MKVITYKGSSDWETAKVIPLADFHIGDRNCDMTLVKRLIDEVKNTPNMLCTLSGDLIDAAVKTSVGDTYGAALSPMEQLKRCTELFADIADKVICIHGGNHEARIYKNDGLDISEMMALQLGIAERYTPTTALVFLEFGHLHHGNASRYTIYSTHGSRGGRKEGAKALQLADLAAIVDADCYICAHTHLPMTFKEAYYRVDPTHRTVSKVTKLFVNTAAALDYGGYGDTKGFKPSATEYPIIEFTDAKDYKMRAIL